MRLWPIRPHRCMQCHHRFWRREAILSDSRRWWAWLALAGVASLLLIFVFSITGQRDLTGDMVSNDAPSTLPQQLPAPATRSLPIPKVSAQRAVRQRELVAGLDFSQPDRPAEIESTLQVATPEMLARAQANAKAATRAAEQAQASLGADRVEQEALLRVKIAYQTEQWRSTWQSGNVLEYLSFYDDVFVPAKGLNKEQWLRQRVARVSPQRGSRIALSDFDVAFSDDWQRITVTFTQRYQANNYDDTSRKELVWVQRGDTWKIASEREVN